MRNITYTLIGLLFVGLLFAGSSFADSGKMTVCDDSSQAMRLLGATLYTPGGTYIGEVNDLAIDPSTGRIDSVLVNRIIGLGAREVAIPFDDISERGPYTFVYNPSQGADWPSVGYSGQLPYYAYGFGHLTGMPEGDHRFTELIGSRECG